MECMSSKCSLKVVDNFVEAAILESIDCFSGKPGLFLAVLKTSNGQQC